MDVLNRIISAVDRGYKGSSRSNEVMGVLLGITGLLALWVDNGLAKSLLTASAVVILLLFGWRMVVQSRKTLDAWDRKRRKGRP